MTENILEDYASQQGWNDYSKIILLCRYPGAFEDFLKQQADEENAETIDLG